MLEVKLPLSLSGSEPTVKSPVPPEDTAGVCGAERAAGLYLGLPEERMAVELNSSSYRSAPDTGNAVCWASSTRRMANRA